MNESEFINKYFKPLTSKEAQNLTNDAALYKPKLNTDIVISTDSLAEGIHFFGNENPRDIAKKSLRVNLSDMAAMGATNSVTQQSQVSSLPQSNFEQSPHVDSVQAPPRPKGLDEVEITQPEPILVETEVKQESVSSGVMLACDGTIQGQTGWYHDGMGNTSYWQVDEVGTWTRLG